MEIAVGERGMKQMTKTMNALVHDGQGHARLMKRPVPVVESSTDAVVRVTLSTICTSDLHILHGAVPRAQADTVLGHEFVGEVVAVGEKVQTIRPGDRVAANCITFCGDCWFCRRGYINNCVHGGWELGCRIDGCQAEYVRVPFADQGLTRIPNGVTDEGALFVGDILASGYFGAELCAIQPGDTVAVIGAGPVGLCAMQCARLLGAQTVVALEIDPWWRQFAAAQGLADRIVDPGREDAQGILASLTDGRGADGVIEAAGGADTFSLAWRIARPNGTVALVAMYEKNQVLPLPVMYGKNLTFKTGGVDAVHSARLLDWIAQGKLSTDYLITHRGPLNEILEGYRVFGGREEPCLKWAVTPWEGEQA